MNISCFWLSEWRLRSSALFRRGRYLTIVQFIIILIRAIFYWSMSWVNDKWFGFFLALIVYWLFFFLFHVGLRGGGLHLRFEFVVEHLQFQVRAFIEGLIIGIDKVGIIFLTWGRFKRWGIVVVLFRLSWPLDRTIDLCRALRLFLHLYCLFLVNGLFFSKRFLLRNDNRLRLIRFLQIILFTLHLFLLYFRRFLAVYLWLIYLLLDTMNRFLRFDDIAWFWTLFTWGGLLIWYLGFWILMGIRMYLNFIDLGGFFRFLFDLLEYIRIFRWWLYWRAFYWFLYFGTGV